MAIALDAMGGDLAPAATVKGALRAGRERGLEVILVATDVRLRVELRRPGVRAEELRIPNASEPPLAEVYARRILIVARPSIGPRQGDEEEKGTDRTRAAAAALRKPGSRVHFTIEDELEGPRKVRHGCSRRTRPRAAGRARCNVHGSSVPARIFPPAGSPTISCARR